MPEAPPSTLMDGMIGATELVAEPAGPQLAWCQQKRIPINEIMLSFTDVVPMFFARIEEAGLLSPEGRDALMALKNHFDYMDGLHDDDLWDDSGLTKPEWDEARRLAEHALEVIDWQQRR